jgi:hypothetical protein
MTDDRKAGIALIAGSLGVVVTMAIHPTGSVGALNAEQAARLATASGAAHSLAMASSLILFLGACGLARKIAADDRVAFAGLVTFGFACVAVMMAVAVSGFIVPAMLERMTGDAAAAAPQWRIAITGIFQINQAMAKIYSVGASLAIVLWSISVLRNGGLGRGIAVYGCIAAVAITAAIVVGHLRMNVHGMGAVVLAQAIWFVAAGLRMARVPDVDDAGIGGLPPISR